MIDVTSFFLRMCFHCFAHSRTFIFSFHSISSSSSFVYIIQAGVGVAVVGSMPSVGLYFGVYSFCKRRLEDLNPDNQTLNIALSAAIGNTIASSARVPCEVIKQKLQTGMYANMGEAFRDLSLKTMFPTGGIASQMLRDIPYAVITLLCYEHLKSVWKPRAQRAYPGVPNRSWDLVVGGTSGGVGSFLTNPFDVVKTRLQTSSEAYGGSIRTCLSTTWGEGGPQAFLRGSLPRLLHKIPANAFFFLFYECFRTLLRVEDCNNSNGGGGGGSNTVVMVEKKKDRRNRQ
jgi:solute carrier family 25 S-adenosylmethionine transporter 26